MIWIKCNVCGAHREICRCDGEHCEERGCDPDNKAMLSFAREHTECGDMSVCDSYGRETQFKALHKQPTCEMCQGTRWIQLVGLTIDDDRPIRAVCPACNQHGECKEEPADWSKVPTITGSFVQVGRPDGTS